MNTGSHARTLLIRLTALMLGLLLLVLVAVTAYTVFLFNRELRPEIQRTSHAVATVVGNQIVDAVTIGIPFHGLVGMADFLDGLIHANSSIEYIIVTDDKNMPVFRSGSSADDVLAGHDLAIDDDMAEVGAHYDTVTLMHDETGAVLGGVHVGMPRRFVESHIGAILFDELTVVLMSLLITIEALMVMVALFIQSPIDSIGRLVRNGIAGDFTRFLSIGEDSERGRFAQSFNAIVQMLNQRMRDLWYDARDIRAAQLDPTVADSIDAAVAGVERRFTLARTRPLPAPAPDSLLRVRIPLFVFMLSEALVAPFVPLYARELGPPVPWLSPNLAAALPIVTFLVVSALLSPLALRWRRRWSTCPLFLVAAVPAVIGFIGCALAPDLGWLVASRAIGAAGYAAIAVACRGYVVRSRSADKELRGTAVFMGAVFTAAVCGPAIGGILAERLGMPVTFGVSALLMVLAAVLSALLLNTADQADPQAEAGTCGFAATAAMLLRRRPFVALATFCAIPSAVIVTGVMAFLAPLYLSELGCDLPVLGRMLMLYGLANLAFGPMVARMAGRSGTHAAGLVVIGGALAGLAAAIMLWRQGGPAMLLVIAGTGLAHAASLLPQKALVREACRQECWQSGSDTVLEVFRTIERLAGAVAVTVLALLAGVLGIPAAIGLAGLLSLTGALAFLAFLRTGALETGAAGTGAGDLRQETPV
jgi:predicted MFS family arabinose efflux permease